MTDQIQLEKFLNSLVSLQKDIHDFGINRQYYPQVNLLGIEKQFIKKKFEIQISIQRSNNTNKLDYLVTLPSFVI